MPVKSGKFLIMLARIPRYYLLSASMRFLNASYFLARIFLIAKGKIVARTKKSSLLRNIVGIPSKSKS